MSQKTTRTAFVIWMLWACLPAASADLFNISEHMIPMRDGVKLHTVVFTPKGRSAALPILFVRTPYGVSADERAETGSYEFLNEDGYILAFQDIRGRFKSEGVFVMQRPPRNRQDRSAVDESTDAYDSIEWMTKNLTGNNGRVGMMGVSYPGWLVTMALLDPHPALKAASEQATPADMFLGDDFHHNGAFRLSYGFEYAALLETSKEANTNFAFDHADTYQSYLDLGVLSNVNEKYFHGKMPTWNDFVAHPNYDDFWQKQAFPRYINGSPKVPNLNVAGWWDQEDFYGPVKVYELFEKSDPQRLNYLVAGPWNHGGWRRADGSKLGEIPFDSNTSKYFRQHVEAPWFAYWLHDKGSRNFAEATVFQTGSNRWEQYDSWPPKSAKPSNLYLRAGGSSPSMRPGPLKGTARTRISPIPHTRFPTGIVRSAPRILAAAGLPGWSRISDSSITARMCSRGERNP